MSLPIEVNNLRMSHHFRQFEKEIVPYEIRERKSVKTFAVDEHPRLTTVEKLGGLKPVFNENGTVTAGNSSGRNDGASAVVLMSGEAVKNMA